ncbi:MAG: DNA/RNA non-specific endonuclease [Nitrospira sp.]|nr:DNA/RNA non-specific endonuclease [Nitrospira sp.]
MESLKSFVRAQGLKYLNMPNITSVGIGHKIKGGVKLDKIAVSFTVGKKAKPEALEALGTQSIPTSFLIEGVEVPTDVIEREYAPSFKVLPEAGKDLRKQRLDPIVPGGSVGHPTVTAGTIGCVVYDRQDGTPCILSNWHVLQGPSGKIGDVIVQPGPFDDNRVESNAAAVLVRSHLGPAGDCAIARIEGRGYETKPLDLDLAPTRLGEPELRDKVIKSGRTTSVTHGVVSRIHVTTKLDYESTVGEVQVGGFEIEPDLANLPGDDEVSKGGDSGSVWVFKTPQGKASDIIAGLHFAGEGTNDPHEHALACYSSSVFEKLDITLKQPIYQTAILAASGASDRRGFDPKFLKTPVPLPTLSAQQKKDVFTLQGSEVIPYTHFSLTISKAKKFAFWVGWNIDGGQLKKYGRTNLDFGYDPRVPEEYQTGNDLYENNRLDRGHIARRADLVWGPPKEAQQANLDSFYFTNITPQMDTFNQGQRGGLWGRLEDAIYEDALVDRLRVSVFGGPIFLESDPVYRGSRIPREFWKVLTYVDEPSQELRTSAFLLTQKLSGLEALELPEFQVYQVSLRELEERSNLDFGTLKKADHFRQHVEKTARAARRRPETLEERSPLRRVDDIQW